MSEESSAYSRVDGLPSGPRYSREDFIAEVGGRFSALQFVLIDVIIVTHCDMTVMFMLLGFVHAPKDWSCVDVTLSCRVMEYGLV
jgi:hypothetical protein